MADKSTFIKLDRKILDWRWYTDANTMRVFLHLLLKANIRDKDFQKITVHRGELVTSYPSLALELGLSIQQARTAIAHLKETGEITVTVHSKYSIISIKNYDDYQRNNSQPTVNQQSSNSQKIDNFNDFSENEHRSNSQSLYKNHRYSDENCDESQLDNRQLTGNQQSTNRQSTTIKESKECKNIITKHTTTTRMCAADVLTLTASLGYEWTAEEAENFIAYNDAKGWQFPPEAAAVKWERQRKKHKPRSRKPKDKPMTQRDIEKKNSYLSCVNRFKEKGENDGSDT